MVSKECVMGGCAQRVPLSLSKELCAACETMSVLAELHGEIVERTRIRLENYPSAVSFSCGSVCPLPIEKP